MNRETIREAARRNGAILIDSKTVNLAQQEIWLAIGELGELCFRKFIFGFRDISIFTWSRMPIVKDNGFTWWIHTHFKTD